MTPRLRRLMADRDELAALAAQSDIELHAEGDPPDRYTVTIKANGLERGEGGEVHLRAVHEFAVQLPLDYPRRPPFVVWQTPVFHPNLLGPERHGAVCVGSWSAGESLADLCRRLIDLVSYRSFNLDDALDKDAAAWVRSHGVAPGVDLDALPLA